MAIQDIKGYHQVLEIGCGRGDFVQRLCQEEKIDAQGIELNISGSFVTNIAIFRT
jgi:cyclopropane fatty-acyl-phospholipid synthase-like methyltransferase